ncbi:MAG TPA: long-chain fatty acid--CoA ligase [Candidatus Binataceae bacterium]|nr:long-chain fatty acid--CoA ligase [Candidatus Binataceae bacterium]
MPEHFSTLAAAFDYQARKYGARTLLKQKRDKVWRDFSWNQVSDAAAKLRAGLIRMGIRPGDRVAILSDNSPQWVIVDQAILGLGAITTPLFTTSGAEEHRHVLNDSGARIIAANSDDMVKKVVALGSAIPGIEGIIAMHPGATAQPASNGTPPIMTMESASEETPAPIAEGKREDLATFIYTSGTTGPSKGVMLTHGNILANAEDAVAVLGVNEGDSILSFLPVAHSFERTAGYYTVVLGGGEIAYAEGLTQIPANLQEIKPTLLLVVPRLLEAIYDRVQRTVRSSPPLRQKLFHLAIATGKRATMYRHGGKPIPPLLALQMAIFRKLVFHRIQSVFGGRMRYLISGSAPLSTEIYDFLAAAEIPLVEGYGLTEAAPIVSVNLLPGRAKIGTVGRALPHVEVKTVSDGELLVRGPNVMKGYYRLDKDTGETIDGDGWLHTGDIAQIDGDGFIKITDRKKEIIVLSGGKNISPAYLENRLTHDPYISQACVFGDRRKHLAALIVPNFEHLTDVLKEKGLASKPHDELVTSSEVRAFFQARMREFNKPLSDVEAISAFTLIAQPFTQENGEMTPTMKVRRRVVQQHYQTVIDAMFRD